MLKKDEELLIYVKTTCLGRENAHTGADLSSMFGCNIRDIQKRIARIREDEPILSANGEKAGYYYPTPGEAILAMRDLQSIERRAKTTLKKVSTVKRVFGKKFGSQLHLDLKEAG